MATVNFSVAVCPGWKDKAQVYTWASMANGDIGQFIETVGWADRSVQITGTFGSGGTLSIEGSNDGSNWATLTDPQGNAIAITSAKIEQVMEITRYLRPNVTAGNGSTSLTVSLLARRNN